MRKVASALAGSEEVKKKPVNVNKNSFSIAQPRSTCQSRRICSMPKNINEKRSRTAIFLSMVRKKETEHRQISFTKKPIIDKKIEGDFVGRVRAGSFGDISV